MNDAQKMELDRIAHDGGGLILPSKVVEAAVDRGNPLHDEFTWDDEEAGMKLREQEARQLIRVYVKYLPQAQRNARAYISVPSDRVRGDGYRRTEDVLASPTMVDQMVDELRKRISSLAESYGYLRFMDGLWPKLMEQLEKFLQESRVKAAG